MNSSNNIFDVDFQYTGYNKFNTAVYIGTQTHLSSYYFAISDVSTHLNSKLDICFDYTAEFFIDDSGMEDYDVSSKDKNNGQNFKTNRTFTVGQLI